MLYVKNAEKTFDKSDLFYCYSPKLKKYLNNTKGIVHIARGTNNSNNKLFWLFIRSEELHTALEDWSKNKQKQS